MSDSDKPCCGNFSICRERCIPLVDHLRSYAEQLAGLLKECMELSDNWPGVSYTALLESRVSAALDGWKRTFPFSSTTKPRSPLTVKEMRHFARETLEMVEARSDYEQKVEEIADSLAQIGNAMAADAVKDSRTQSNRESPNTPRGWAEFSQWFDALDVAHYDKSPDARDAAWMGWCASRERIQVCNHRDLIKAVRALVFAARTSGGVAGRDETLCAVLDVVESLLPPMVGIDASDGDSRTVAGQKS